MNTIDSNFNTEKKLSSLTYGFFGLGLMGGSLAKAIRSEILNIENSQGRILASDCRIQTLEEAKKEKIIDDFYSVEETQKMLSKCDIVFICLYPKATKEFIKNNINYFKENAIITDISGVKTELVESFPQGLKGINPETTAQFIPGHPMAGSEKEGFINSNSKIFAGRNYILMPYENTKQENLDILKSLIYKIGFTNIITTDYKTHDHKIAFTSQLCHIIASALVESAEDTQITQFGGGSFEDLTRIAMINAPLWTELFLANKNELLNHIESFEKSLDKLKKQIQDEENKNLQENLELVRSKRILMVENTRK